MSSQFPFFSGIQFQDQNLATLKDLENGNYHEVLRRDYARKILGSEVFKISASSDTAPKYSSWIHHLATHADRASDDFAKQALLLIGHAALQAFLQSNVTGPPLDWAPAEVILPEALREDEKILRSVRVGLLRDLSVDGEAVYQLTPHIELFYLAKLILNHDSICTTNGLRWARVRVNFWHQRILSENAASLMTLIYSDLAYLDNIVLGGLSYYDQDVKTSLLLERAAIHNHHGLERKAREDLADASRLRGFEYVLTGQLGKRTKFQQQEVSQLVVLAKSKDVVSQNMSNCPNTDLGDVSWRSKKGDIKPTNIDLNDDTLFESISFSQKISDDNQSEGHVPPTLAALDPSNQPILNPLDSILLLSYASSITNTSPEDGLTREETLPYATRVLNGGSSNWQVYTQALIVRSRIEGYRSRTVERGALQLQALVDQVVAETTGVATSQGGERAKNAIGLVTNTFLPQAKANEIAPAQDRLLFVNQLASPPRWSLEAELAARWVSLGGLRTALEIFERLEMWAEAALCWAATEREDRALNIVRSQLYMPGQRKVLKPLADDKDTEVQYYGDERQPLPTDAPRLFCILGDIEKSLDHYERAWEVSNHRYARAQRSLGKYHLSKGQLAKSEDAYTKSLKANPQNSATWFTLGCVRLELREWRGAVNAFSRTVSSDPEDGEAWSNLAAALLRLPVNERAEDIRLEGDDPPEHTPKDDPQKNAKTALVAFKRAATLKRDSYRIWQNVLNVAATISPPPYADVIIAQKRLIELRGATEGEKCVDIEVMEGLLGHILATTPQRRSDAVEGDNFDAASADQRRDQYGVGKMFTELVNKHIVPLITRSRRLWQLVARLSTHLNRPSSALDAYEKAWRLALNQPGWDDGSPVGAFLDASRVTLRTPDKAWEEVVDATVELVDAYESLGVKGVTEGLKAGSGELVCGNWRYKARMAMRNVIGRRTKAGMEGSERLQDRLNDLKGAGGGGS